MFRFKLTIEYDGSPFVGWQRQANGRSVQQAIEEAIERLTGADTRIRGAGRTDAGVHALGQVAHVDLQRDWPGDKLRDALNAHLRPDPVAITVAENAATDFDARYSAIQRSYCYRMVNRRAPLALERGRAWRVARELDHDAMAEAAQALLGTHDFTTFRSTECQARSPIRTLDVLEMRRRGDAVEIHASARSFLHNQVRSIAGSLKLVGEGKWTAGDLERALRARDRKACGPVAPPEGLYLLRVEYPAD